MNNKAIPAKGYLIANFTIHDEETFKKYIEAGSSLNWFYEAMIKPVE